MPRDSLRGSSGAGVPQHGLLAATARHQPEDDVRVGRDRDHEPVGGAGEPVAQQRADAVDLYAHGQGVAGVAVELLRQRGYRVLG